MFRRCLRFWRPSRRCLLALWLYAWAWSLTPLLINEGAVWAGAVLWAGTAALFGSTLAHYQHLLQQELTGVTDRES